MRLPLVLAALALGGCSHTYTLIRQDSAPARVKLPREASAYIVLPANGAYGDQEYPKSGARTAASLSEALKRRLTRVRTGDTVEEYQAALTHANAEGLDYIFLPVIMHWEERATEWSGKPDRILVRLFVFDTGTGQEIDSVDIGGRSKWFTFGGDHPEELLDDPIERYVAGLF